MGIEAWSTTAASNNAATPNGWPENQAPSTVNDCARQMMASMRAWFEDAQWVNFGHTPTRIDNDTFTVATDLTAIYHVGRRLKLTGSATGYCTITASSYGAPNTTVDVLMDSGNIPGTLSAVYVSILSFSNAAYPTIPVTSGGTGAITASAARTNLGMTATGADTAYAFRANNLSDLASAATARTNLGLGTLATQSGTFSGTSSGTNTGDQTNISGNAATATTATNVTTNANLTGPVTSVGNATSIASGIALPGNPTTTTQSVGTSNSMIATTQHVSPAFSLSSLGYAKLACGLYIQWGTSSSLGPTGSEAQTFAVAFPANCFGVQITRDEATGSNSFSASVNGITTSGFTLYNNGGRTGPFYWFAIGN